MLSIEDVAADKSVFRPDGTIFIPRSDGVLDYRPAVTAPDPFDVEQIYHHVFRRTDQRHAEWRSMLGELLRKQFGLPAAAPNGMGWQLHDFPQHYLLTEERKGNRVPPYKYQVGSVTKKLSAHVYVREGRRFRGCNELLDHLTWLLQDPELNDKNCTCILCSPKRGSRRSSRHANKRKNRDSVASPADQPSASTSGTGLEEAAKDKSIFRPDGSIVIPRSDGNREQCPTKTALPRPGDTEVDYYRIFARNDALHADWRKTLGGLLRAHFSLPDVSDTGANWHLDDLPRNYFLTERHKGRAGAENVTIAVFGCPGCKFGTPRELAKHLAWLISDSQLDSENCTCRFCSQVSQLPPSKRQKRDRRLSRSPQQERTIPAESSVHVRNVESRPFAPPATVTSVPQRDKEIMRRFKRGESEGFRVGEVVWCTLPQPIKDPECGARRIHGWPVIILFITVTADVIPIVETKQEMATDSPEVDQDGFTLAGRVHQETAYQVHFLGTMESAKVEESDLLPYLVGFVRPEQFVSDLGSIEKHPWLATENVDAPCLNLMHHDTLPRPAYAQSIVAFAYAVQTASMLRSFYSLTDAFSHSSTPEGVLEDLGTGVREIKLSQDNDSASPRGRRFYQGMHYGTERIWVGEMIRLKLSPNDVYKVQAMLNATVKATEASDTPAVVLDQTASYVMRLASIYEDPVLPQKAQISGEMFEIMTMEKYNTLRDAAPDVKTNTIDDLMMLDAEYRVMEARLPQPTVINGKPGFAQMPPLPQGFVLLSLNERLQTRVSREATLSIGYVAGRLYPSLSTADDHKRIPAAIAARPTDRKKVADEDTQSDERAHLSAAGLLSGCVKAMGCKVDSYSLNHSLHACFALARRNVRELVLRKPQAAPAAPRSEVLSDLSVSPQPPNLPQPAAVSKPSDQTPRVTSLPPAKPPPRSSSSASQTSAVAVSVNVHPLSAVHQARQAVPSPARDQMPLAAEPQAAPAAKPQPIPMSVPAKATPLPPLQQAKAAATKAPKSSASFSSVNSTTSVPGKPTPPTRDQVSPVAQPATSTQTPTSQQPQPPARPAQTAPVQSSPRDPRLAEASPQAPRTAHTSVPAKTLPQTPKPAETSPPVPQASPHPPRPVERSTSRPQSHNRRASQPQLNRNDYARSQHDYHSARGSEPRHSDQAPQHYHPDEASRHHHQAYTSHHHQAYTSEFDHDIWCAWYAHAYPAASYQDRSHYRASEQARSNHYVDQAAHRYDYDPSYHHHSNEPPRRHYPDQDAYRHNTDQATDRRDSDQAWRDYYAEQEIRLRYSDQGQRYHQDSQHRYPAGASPLASGPIPLSPHRYPTEASPRSDPIQASSHRAPLETSGRVQDAQHRHSAEASTRGQGPTQTSSPLVPRTEQTSQQDADPKASTHAQRPMQISRVLSDTGDPRPSRSAETKSLPPQPIQAATPEGNLVKASQVPRQRSEKTPASNVPASKPAANKVQHPAQAPAKDTTAKDAVESSRPTVQVQSASSTPASKAIGTPQSAAPSTSALPQPPVTKPKETVERPQAVASPASGKASTPAAKPAGVMQQQSPAQAPPVSASPTAAVAPKPSAPASSVTPTAAPSGSNGSSKPAEAAVKGSTKPAKSTATAQSPSATSAVSASKGSSLQSAVPAPSTSAHARKPSTVSPVSTQQSKPAASAPQSKSVASAPTKPQKPAVSAPAAASKPSEPAVSGPPKQPQSSKPVVTAASPSQNMSKPASSKATATTPAASTQPTKPATPAAPSSKKTAKPAVPAPSSGSSKPLPPSAPSVPASSTSTKPAKAAVPAPPKPTQAAQPAAKALPISTKGSVPTLSNTATTTVSGSSASMQPPKPAASASSGSTTFWKAGLPAPYPPTKTSKSANLTPSGTDPASSQAVPAVPSPTKPSKPAVPKSAVTQPKPASSRSTSPTKPSKSTASTSSVSPSRSASASRTAASPASVSTPGATTPDNDRLEQLFEQARTAMYKTEPNRRDTSVSSVADSFAGDSTASDERPANTIDKHGPLPPAWVWKVSRSMGSIFYYNKRTEKRQWKRPTE